MSRINPITTGPFTTMLSQNQTFDDVKTKLPNESPELTTITNQYVQLIGKSKDNIQKLAQLEEIMIQLRIRDNLNTPELKKNLKAVVIDSYIYIRCPFRRVNKTAQEIRALVGTKTIFKGVKNYTKNEKFMNAAIPALYDVMSKVINENMSKLK